MKKRSIFLPKLPDEVVLPHNARARSTDAVKVAPYQTCVNFSCKARILMHNAAACRGRISADDANGVGQCGHRMRRFALRRRSVAQT
ncbi:protein of unknown function [Burkholderia multivorans]